MLLLEHLHPATVHFPLALLLVGSLLALVQLYRRPRVDLRWTIWFLLIVGWLGVIAAVLTGLLAQSNLPPDAPYRDVLNWHIGAGLAQLVVYGILLYRGWIYRTVKARKARAAKGQLYEDLLDDPSARNWIAVLLVVGMVLLVVTGWNGGILVYTWGVNVG